jgi:peptide/nickel transport system permease protein
MTAAAWIVLWLVAAIFAYLFIPDKTTHANEQIVEIKLKRPGFRIAVLALGSRDSARGIFHNMFQGRDAVQRLIPITRYEFRDDSIHVGHYMGEGAVLPESYSITEMSDGETTSRDAIEREHILPLHFILGTDVLGRDFLSRLVLGARVSLAVGFAGMVISLLIGLTLGLLAGWFRGGFDDVITYFSQVFWAIPTLLLALCLSLVMGNGLWQVFLAIGLTMWVDVARIVRGQVMLVRELPYIQATRALGLGQARVILKHVLPNITGPVLVVMAANFAAAILLEAGLSFLGLGVSSPTPSWGMMLSENRNYLVAGMPHLAILPGAAICVLVLAFFAISNGLRDAFDVRGKP